MPLPLLPILGALAQFAPQISKWLDAGKTVQEVVETASTIAKSVTGTSNTDDALASLGTNPELAAAYQNKIMDMDMEYERLYISDKADARKRAAVLDSTPHGNVRANWLVAIAVVMIASCMAMVVMSDLNENAKTTIAMILGMFLNELKNIYSFEFGTTRRSRAKTDVMAADKAD